MDIGLRPKPTGAPHSLRTTVGMRSRLQCESPANVFCVLLLFFLLRILS